MECASPLFHNPGARQAKRGTAWRKRVADEGRHRTGSGVDGTSLFYHSAIDRIDDPTRRVMAQPPPGLSDTTSSLKHAYEYIHVLPYVQEFADDARTHSRARRKQRNGSFHTENTSQAPHP
jgi:hypothetical protein